MRTIIFALMLLAAVPASAASFVFPKGVVTDGDGAGALTQRAGQPDRIVRIENEKGAAVGERWEYYLREKQVNFTMVNGRITRIEEIRN